MLQLARRMGRAKPSAIMLIAEKAKRLKAEGRDIVSFSIGVPNFLPGEHVYAAAREALSHDSGQYGSNRGSDALLDAFIAHMAEIGLTGYTRANCATGVGAKHVIYNLAEALLDEGDTIVFPAPYWTAISTSPRSSTRRSTCCRVPPSRTTSSRPRSSMRRWRRSRASSCSTIRRIRPAWSIRRMKSARWPMSW